MWPDVVFQLDISTYATSLSPKGSKLGPWALPYFKNEQTSIKAKSLPNEMNP